MIVMAIFGNDFWMTPLPIQSEYLSQDILLRDFMMVTNIIIQVGIVGACLKNIFDHQKKSEEEKVGEPLRVRDLTVQIFGYVLAMVATTLLATIGQEPLISDKK
jgi:hypothetical protein